MPSGNWYETIVLPRLIHLSMRQKKLAEYRPRVVSAAKGRVLEVGIGSGLNLPFYPESVEGIIGLDSSPALLAMSRKARKRSRIPVTLMHGTAESVPLEDASVDTVVMTWTLCSILDPGRALAELWRVLKADGELLFVEHGRAPDLTVRKWQDRLTPVWKKIGGGCHLNRPIEELIASAGFMIDGLTADYMKNAPRAFAYMYEGRARRT